MPVTRTALGLAVVVGALALVPAAPAFAQAGAPAGAGQDAAPPAVAAAASDDPYFDFLLGRRLEGEGDDAGALAAFERAAKADPKSSEIRAEIAGYYLRQNDEAQAEREANAALALEPDNIEAHRVLGLIFATRADGERDRQGAQALDYARQAVQHLEPVVASVSAATDIGIQYTLGRLYMRTGQPDKAVTLLARVVNQNPGSLQARLTLSQAYAANDDLPGAIDTLSAVVDQQPRVAALLGQYQEQAGRLTDAADSYGKALALAPTNRELKFRRLVVLYGARRYADVATLAADAEAEHPDDLRFPRLEARALFASGARDRAFAVMERAARAHPEDSPTQLALADLYSDGGRKADAERTLRDLVAGQPRNADALNYLGYLLADQGQRLDEAIALVQRALDIDPGNPSYLDSLGWAFFRKGDLDEALSYLQPAADQLPRNAVIQDHLGDLRFRQGRLEDAIAAWTRALDGDGGIDRPAVQQKIQDAQGKLPH